MRYEEKWVVRLHVPIIVGTQIRGIGRHEVINTLILEMLPSGPGNDAEDVLEMWKSIDWERSETLPMERFECCDIKGAMHRAQAEARERAEIYANAVEWEEAHGHTMSHPDDIEYLRLVRATPLDDAA